MSYSQPDFNSSLRDAGVETLKRSELKVLQINLGKVCNQTCAHCHVDAGPRRTESMEQNTADACIRFLAACPQIDTLDITGGAPEMNPHFRHLVREGRALGRNVISRCNLTILFEAGHEDLAEFYAKNQVEITASLPCYLEENVDKQRGRGVFEKSIEALRLLNSFGYGTGNPHLRLNLVYNPVGASLPPLQEQLEVEYKRELHARYGITFDHLFTITNLPIARFERFLRVMGNYESYMTKLVDAFNPVAAEAVMCKTLLSVSWDGRLYDCDFNQMLDMALRDPSGELLDIQTARPEHVIKAIIMTGSHCYGCTAGSGSSCGRALAKN